MPARRPRVLVADDAELVRWALDRALRANGFDVSMAGSRSDLMGSLIGSGFDVVVLSRSLGVDTVGDLVAQVRRHRPSTGIILLVDHTEVDDVQRADGLTGGGNLVVFEKPFSMSDVVSAARRLGASPLSPTTAG